MEQGTPVWFDGGIGYPLPGHWLKSLDKDFVEVKGVTDGKKYKVHDSSKTLRVRHDNIEVEEVEDMISLRDLHEGSLIFNLETRYNKGLIYTYTGSILVAVNPYQLFDIYGVDTVKKYEGKLIGQLPPHLFAIGNSAYLSMQKDGKNQCIVISGESGAGKTESTKLIMQYLAAINKSSSNLITEQILEANPLLESFGNAKTIRNDNSSRFGKYIEVYFTNGSITGAKTTDYLLEKSRIAHQAEGERNYHIFYEMIEGMSEGEKAKYGLRHASNFRYLNQGGSSHVSSRQDAESFIRLVSAMEILKFQPAEMENVFSVLAAVLHLGNVQFTASQHGRDESLRVSNVQELRKSAQLLMVSSDKLEKAMTQKFMREPGGERIMSPLTREQANDARDAIGKSLYSTLFTWLIQNINKVVNRPQKVSSIAILDIFGFEDFQTNSFEQLCINYANENLHFFFNRHIFNLEQEEYVRERIKWTNVAYKDNQPCLDMIGKRPIGIFHILDDESSFPRGMDSSFIEKCHHNHRRNECYKKPKMSKMEFGIQHYAGLVTYSAKGFLDKNRDMLRADVLEMLIKSKSQLVSKMFKNLRKSEETRAMMTQGLTSMKKMRASTVATRFNESLGDLMDNMTKCNPFFIRCIKPNNDKLPMSFNNSLVMDQLRYSGMLETIRIRKLGYPIRMTFLAFIDRYRFLVGQLSLRVPKSELCIQILNTAGESFARDYQIGSKKVFLRERLESDLEYRRSAIVKNATLVIQRYTKGFLMRKLFQKQRKSAIEIQARFRGWQARRKFKLIIRSIICLQAAYRGYQQRKKYRMLIQVKTKHNAIQQTKRTAPSMPKSSSPIDVSRLDIPYDLSLVLNKTSEWNQPHTERNVVKVVGKVAQTQQMISFPLDINQFPFSKYVNIYFRNSELGVLSHPIASPFHNLNDEEEIKALAIFKLIQRFMGDQQMEKNTATIYGNYIVQEGLSFPKLRDEIYSQLCNQTFGNVSEAENERGWLLMANLLGCVPPSKKLYKYLLKYVSDHAYNGYKSYCQHKLLFINPYALDFGVPRTYPSTLLEWKAHRLRSRMALKLAFMDGQEMTVQVDSWTTGEEIVAAALRARKNEKNLQGWSLQLQEGTGRYELSGFDYVLDLIGEMELPPDLPVQESNFLVSSETIKMHPVQRKTMTNTRSGVDIDALLEGDTVMPNYQPAAKWNGRAPSEISVPSVPETPYPDYDIDDEVVQPYQMGYATNQRNLPTIVETRQDNSSSDAESMHSSAAKSAMSVGGKIRSVPIPFNGTGDQLDNYVDDVFNPVLETGDLFNPLLMEKSLRGGGKGPPGYMQTPMYQVPQQPAMFNMAAQPTMAMNPGMVPTMVPGMMPTAVPAMQGYTAMPTMNPYQMQVPMAPAMAPQPVMTQPFIDPSTQAMQQMMQQQSVLNQQTIAAQQQQIQQQQMMLQTMMGQQATGSSSSGPSTSGHKLKSAMANSQETSKHQNKKLQFNRTVVNIKTDTTPEYTDVLVSPTSSGSPQVSPQAEQMQIPPGIPPPPPINEEKMLLLKRGKVVDLDDDRARTIRVGKVVWPPRGGDGAGVSGLKPVKSTSSEIKSTIKSAPSEQDSQSHFDLIKERANKMQQRRENGETKFPPPKPAAKPKPKLSRGSSFQKKIDDHTLALEKLRSRGIDFDKRNQEPVKSSPVKTSPVKTFPVKPSNVQTPLPPPPPPPVLPVGLSRPGPPPPPPPPPPPLDSVPEVEKESSTDARSEALNILMSKGLLPKKESTIISKPQKVPKTTADAKKVTMFLNAHNLVKSGSELIEKSPTNASPRLELLEETTTSLFPLSSQAPFYTYSLINWQLNIRKEVFCPGEKLESPMIIDLLFVQVVSDVMSNSCIRLSKKDKMRMQLLFDKNSITVQNLKEKTVLQHKSSVKKEVLSIAQTLPLYFTRFFPVTGGRKNPKVELLGVSHTGVRLVHREYEPTKDQLVILESFKYPEVVELKVTQHGTLRIYLSNDMVIPLYTKRAAQIKSMIEAYIIDLERDSQHVRAVKDYVTQESTLLSFRRGDVIKLAGASQSLNSDWLYGMVNGKTGSFPSEYVVPAPGPDSHRQPRRSEDIHDDLLDIPLKMQNYLQDNQAMSGKSSMLEFAMRHFRESHSQYEMRRRSNGSISGSLRFMGSIKKPFKGKKSKQVQRSIEEYEELIRFSNSPLQVSLLKLSNPDVNKAALECFLALMQIMGDYPVQVKDKIPKEKAYLNCVHFILKTCVEHGELVDEVFCHLIKQTTANQSAKKKSCILGWRMFAFYSSYFQPSNILKPYLYEYLTSPHPDDEQRQILQNLAMTCKMNIVRGFKAGGRRIPPLYLEIKNILDGRLTKRQMFYLPGNMTITKKVMGSTTMQDVVEDICQELNVVENEEIEEYSVFAVVKKNNQIVPLKHKDYIMDVITHFECQKVPFSFLFKKLLWYRPIKVQSPLHAETLFKQMQVEYLHSLPAEGDFNSMSPDKKSMIVQLAALQHKAADKVEMPTMRDLPQMIPMVILDTGKKQQWLNATDDKLQAIKNMSKEAAMVAFIEQVEKLPMSGTNLFIIESVSGAVVHGSCVLAVSNYGIYLLNKKTKECILKHPFTEIVSTRRLRSAQNRWFVDIKCGNLMVQKVTRLETEQGSEITVLISQYIQAQVDKKYEQPSSQILIPETHRKRSQASSPPLAQVDKKYEQPSSQNLIPETHRKRSQASSPPSPQPLVNGLDQKTPSKNFGRRTENNPRGMAADNILAMPPKKRSSETPNGVANGHASAPSQPRRHIPIDEKMVENAPQQPKSILKNRPVQIQSNTLNDLNKSINRERNGNYHPISGYGSNK
ncbi:unconventional myosin-XV-like isoform X3 [Anneissia japonica]|uniref:unconventional myosin-XV-like isoform X3 n=1 Tax=Anneissia japonica TaxID=1529436 RepID=UPI001425AB0F|nr:unconventional myosin-XV-like isoform X3 [Anneissia japonica]